MKNITSVMYRIDEQDKLVFVNLEWLRFALDNETPELMAENILHHSLWDFIADETTQQIYQEIVGKARNGDDVNFTFRCDSAACRKQLEMTVSLVENDEIQFETKTLWTQNRAPQALLDPAFVRTEELLRICGWCKQIDVGTEEWKEVEEALSILNLFEQKELPQLTHGICNACYRTMTEKLALRKQK